MFGSNSAAACCGSDPATIASKTATISLPVAGTPSGASIAFPMRDPYSPASNARVPIPGLNRFPGRYNVMDSRYYGLGRNGAATRRRGGRFAGMGGVFDDLSFMNYPSTGNSSSSGSSTLQSILATIQSTLPATISALKGKPYYDTTKQQVVGQSVQTAVGAVGAGGGAGSDVGATAGAAVGGLGDAVGKIVTENPLLVLAGVTAVVLLFMKSPSRGR